MAAWLAAWLPGTTARQHQQERSMALPAQIEETSVRNNQSINAASQPASLP